MLFKQNVDYLAHNIIPGKMTADVEPTKEILESPLPNEKRRMRSLLGACNLYRRFLFGLVKLERTMNAMIKKGAEVN